MSQQYNLPPIKQQASLPTISQQNTATDVDSNLSRGSRLRSGYSERSQTNQYANIQKQQDEPSGGSKLRDLQIQMIDLKGELNRQIFDIKEQLSSMMTKELTKMNHTLNTSQKGFSNNF